MVAGAFLAVLWCMGLSFLLCIVGVAATYVIQGPEMAFGLFKSWVFDFNGLLVGGTTWAMVYLVVRHGRSVLVRMLSLLEVDMEESAKLLASYSRAYSWRRILLIGLPIGAFGAWTLWRCGYPLEGFARIYLFVGSGFLHFCAAFVLVYLYYTIKFFMSIDVNPGCIRIKERLSPMDLDSFNTFFVVTASLGIFAAYFAFRGTLTAGFRFPDPLFARLLMYPIVMYLPIGLMYSFYPRFVLKRIADRSILEQIEKLDQLQVPMDPASGTGLEDAIRRQTAIADLREKLRNETKQFPILSVKDYPSLSLLILMFIQYVSQKDSVITKFFEALTK
jgi:hypothetical protein